MGARMSCYSNSSWPKHWATMAHHTGRHSPISFRASWIVRNSTFTPTCICLGRMVRASWCLSDVPCLHEAWAWVNVYWHLFYYLITRTAPLHNQFILANIHNAQREAPPPTTRSVGWSKGKKNKDGTKEQEPKRRKIKNQIMSLGKAERERIKNLKVRPTSMRLSSILKSYH